MAKEFLFKTCLPTAGVMSCISWLLNSNITLHLSLVGAWTIIISIMMIGLKQKWFE